MGPTLKKAVEGTDLQNEDQEKEHFIKQLEDEVREFAIANRIYDFPPLRLPIDSSFRY